MVEGTHDAIAIACISRKRSSTDERVRKRTLLNVFLVNNSNFFLACFALSYDDLINK